MHLRRVASVSTVSGSSPWVSITHWRHRVTCARDFPPHSMKAPKSSSCHPVQKGSGAVNFTLVIGSRQLEVDAEVRRLGAVVRQPLGVVAGDAHGELDEVG